jgi:hypothetical protein
MNDEVSRYLHDLDVSVAALEIATWAAIKAVLEVNPPAAEMFRVTSGALLQGIKGAHAEEVRGAVQKHLNRWMPTS